MFLTSWKADLTFKPLGDSTTHQYVSLSSDQAKQLRNGGTVEQSPKVMLFNGQLCEWFLPTRDGKQPRIHLQPVASSDRRFVRLGLGFDDARNGDEGVVGFAVMPSIRNSKAILLEVTQPADPAAPVVGIPVPGKPRTCQRATKDRHFVLIQPDVVAAEEE